MPRSPAARARAARVLCVGALLTATACGAGEQDRAADATTRSADPASPGTATALTAAQAQAALVTEADLGAPWVPTEGVATWRDGVLKARTDASADCQRLLDALYTDQPLGGPTGTHAVAGYDDTGAKAQLRYQVLSLRPADVDRSLAWLRTMPDKCGRFTATTTGSGTQTVEVGSLDLPGVGDARQGLRVTFTGASDERDQGDEENYEEYESYEEYEDYGDEKGQADTTTLTLDVAAVRVGDDALTLTDGAPGALPSGTTAQAVRQGVERLTAVQHRARVQA
jgi:hypothetical protein